MSRPVLMTVDDDPGVSRAVARDLRRKYGSEFRVVRAESGPDALDALKELTLRGEPTAAILADYRMPGMNGVEFLEKAMDIAPRARRALLTAYADTDAAIRAINVVDVDHYLLKPWEPPEEKLYPVVDALIETWRSVGDRSVEETKVLGHRWSAESFAARDFLARNAVPYRWYNIEEPDGARLLEAAGATADDVPVLVPPDGTVLKSPSEAEIAAAVGPHHHPHHRLLRPHRDRRRSGRAGQRGLRGVGGVADRARRAAGHRWPGRAELPHRELPRLPGRGLRRPAHRPGPPAGGEVRHGGAHRARRRRSGGPRLGPRREVRRRVGDRRAQRRPRDRRVLPRAGGSGRRRPDRPRRLLRLGVHRGPHLPGPRRLHRRRRELRRPGRGVLLPAREVRHAAGARAVARGVDVVLPDQAARGDRQRLRAHPHRGRRGHGRGAPAAARPAQQRDGRAGDRRLRPDVHLHRRRTAHGVARRGRRPRQPRLRPHRAGPDDRGQAARRLAARPRARTTWSRASPACSWPATSAPTPSSGSRRPSARAPWP